MDMHGRNADRLQRWLLPLLVLLAGVWFVPVQHTCLLACVPGDLGDARFNGVVLEHFHRWLMGQEHSLLSPPYFHPMPGAATFSDNHWGTAWIYALFRVLGADRYQAFDLWYLTGFVANFVVSHLVFRRMRFSPLASAVAAFAFTFAMPVISRHGHAQLTYRFLVPVGLLLWQRCLEDGRWRWFAALAGVVALQLYMSIYLAYFLVLLLAAWTLADMLIDWKWPRPWLSHWLAQRRHSSRRERWLAVLVIIVAGAAMAVLMYPYLHYARLYGFSRGLGEISTLTPRPQSYLLADMSRIWGGLSGHLGHRIPERQEHQLFFGVGILSLALVGAVRARTRTAKLAMVSLLLLFALTLTFGRYSLYLAVGLVPGLGAVRAVARIALVMVLPLALLAAMALDTVPRGRWALSLLVAALVVMMGVESATYQTSRFTREDAEARLVALRQQLPVDLPAGAVLFNPLHADTPFYVSELDGVVLAQELGRPTLNGYSGNYAPGYGPEPDPAPCTQARIRLYAARIMHHEHPQVLLAARVPQRVWIIGQGWCSGSSR
jgi:hypothetical protein